MKKVVYILVAIFTFSVGFLLFKLRPLMIPVSIFEITRNAELYKGKKIHVKGYLEVHRSKALEMESYSVFDFKKCFDCLDGASLQMPKGIENNKVISTLVNELAGKNEQTNLDDGVFVAEVKITGKIEEVNACFASRYSIEAEKIEQISSIEYLSDAELFELIGRKNSTQ